MIRRIILLIIGLHVFAHSIYGQYTKTKSLANTSEPTYPLGRGANQLLKASVGLPILRQSSVSQSVYWKDVSLGVTIERKLTNHVALVAGLENHYLFGRYAQLYSLELPLGARYYFSISQRMKKRTQLNGFNRFYLAFQTYNAVFADLRYELPNPNAQKYYRGQVLDHYVSGGKYQEAFDFLQHAYFQVGRQLKFPNSKYLDVNVVIPVRSLVYTKNAWTLATPALITINYGVAWQK